MITEIKESQEQSDLLRHDYGNIQPNWDNTFLESESDFETPQHYGYTYTHDDYFYYQYGHNHEWCASTRFLKQKVELSDEVVNEDNSITVTVRVEIPYFTSRVFSRNMGSARVNYTFSILEEIIDHDIEYTSDVFDLFPNGQVFERRITLQPESEDNRSGLFLQIEYPDNPNYEDSEMTFGYVLYNPLPKIVEYVPCLIRKQNDYVLLNDEPKKKILIRETSTSFKDVSIHELNKQNDLNSGYVRIRKSDGFRQVALSNE